MFFRVSHPHDTDPAHRYSHTQVQGAEDQVYTVGCLPPQRVEWMVMELARERQEPHRPKGKGVPGVGAGKRDKTSWVLVGTFPMCGVCADVWKLNTGSQHNLLPHPDSFF